MAKYNEEEAASQAVSERLVEFVRPLLDELDVQLDKRLVRTFLGLLQVIVLLRHTRYGLLLSELGGYLLGVAYAPAGTKRISNLPYCVAKVGSIRSLTITLATGTASCTNVS